MAADSRAYVKYSFAMQQSCSGPGAAVASSPPRTPCSGPPPPPVSTNGHKVELVASGLKTPTSFAFADGMVFAGDGGNSEGSAPPNGGVYVLKNGTAVKIASPIKFVAGLAWHDNKLYISGAVLAEGQA